MKLPANQGLPIGPRAAGELNGWPCTGLVDMEISGEIDNLTIKGVDIERGVGALESAEVPRSDPESGDAFEDGS